MSFLGHLNEYQWFNGKISACHAGAPGSIPGWCILNILFVVFVRFFVLQARSQKGLRMIQFLKKEVTFLKMLLYYKDKLLNRRFFFAFSRLSLTDNANKVPVLFRRKLQRWDSWAISRFVCFHKSLQK
jgi:hypothetical protein